MALPKKGEAYEFFVTLTDVLNSGKFLANPTIITGDFKISKDEGSFINLTNLPAASPAGSISVSINLTVNEMTADKIVLQGIDSAGLWDDIAIFMDIPSGNIDSVNDLLEGDISESSARVIIKKKGTSTEILNKNISGSLLSPSVTVTTTEP